VVIGYVVVTGWYVVVTGWYVVIGVLTTDGLNCCVRTAVAGLTKVVAPATGLTVEVLMTVAGEILETLTTPP